MDVPLDDDKGAIPGYTHRIGIDSLPQMFHKHQQVGLPSLLLQHIELVSMLAEASHLQLNEIAQPLSVLHIDMIVVHILLCVGVIQCYGRGVPYVLALAGDEI